jgi:hypothetical protein
MYDKPIKPSDHLKESDVRRIEKGTDRRVPLRTSEQDAYVPDTELENSEASKRDRERNDPTTERSASS